MPASFSLSRRSYVMNLYCLPSLFLTNTCCGVDCGWLPQLALAPSRAGARGLLSLVLPPPRRGRGAMDSPERLAEVHSIGEPRGFGDLLQGCRRRQQQGLRALEAGLELPLIRRQAGGGLEGAAEVRL